jgi:uncharacterized protein (UPF0333 family)
MKKEGQKEACYFGSRGGTRSKPRGCRRQGQASTEYLLVVGFAMLMALPIIIVFFEQSNNLNDSLAYSHATNVVQKIAETAESVYYQGYPAQATLTVYFPENINNITIADREINFQMKTSSGISDVYAITSVDVTGSLSTVSGVKKVRVKAMAGFVNISEEE